MWTVRFADLNDLSAIHALWEASFPTDTAQDRDTFLSVVHLSEECLLLCEDARPIAMGFFLPAMWQTYRMRYLYAACTLPAYRSRGAFAHLLNTAHEYLRKHNCDAVFLNPASPSLIGYYERFGYRPTFFVRTADGLACDKSVRVEPLSPLEYVKRRRALLPSVSVVWEDRFLLHEAKGSRLFVVGNGIAMARVDAQQLWVTELLGEEESACAALASHCGVNAYTARLPAPNGTCFGMVCPLHDGVTVPSVGYMGIAMD